MSAVRVGVDLGGTKILAVKLIGDEVAEVKKVKTPQTGDPSDVLDRIASVIDVVDPYHEAEGVGVGMPGHVDRESGVLTAPPNLKGFAEPIAVRDELIRRTGRVIQIDNDVNVATLAEQQVGAARSVDNVLGVFMGTGVGGGVILDGKLRRGPRGLAGEIGHTIIRAGGRKCGCGGRGHLEAYAGRAALERQARKRHAAGDHTQLVEIAGTGRMRSSVWEEAIQHGDPVANALVDEAKDAMIAGITSALVLLDVELVVLGGGFAHRLGAKFRRSIEKGIAAEAFANSGVPVVRSEMGDNSGAIGAAFLLAAGGR